MPKTTYTAIDPAGRTHKRSTSRVYTHTVVALPSKEQAIAQAEASKPYNLKRAQEQFLNASRTVAENRAALAQRHAILARDDSYAQKMTDEGVAFAAWHGTPENYVETMFVKALDEIAAAEAKGFYKVWQNQGWCGRPDLAQKLAAQLTGRVTRILPATAK